MLVIARVNEITCTRCGECIEECPQRLFFKKPDDLGTEVRFSDPQDRCIACGHCIAICPENAVEYKAEEIPLEHPDFVFPAAILGTEELFRFLRARRSIRRFKKQAVERQKLEKILSTMRFAPTASNREKIHYSVIISAEKIAFFLENVISLFKKVKILLHVLRILWPFGRKKPRGILSNGLFSSLKLFLQRVKTGEDPVFWGAPCVLVVSAPDYQHQAGVDTGIALTHGMLAAQAEGLGTCLIGFAHETLLWTARLRKKLGVPKGYRPQGVMVIGYPSVKFMRAPMRKPVSANWL